MAVAGFLFDKAVLSSGQAAEMVGVTKKYFLENIGKYGVLFLVKLVKI